MAASSTSTCFRPSVRPAKKWRSPGNLKIKSLKAILFSVNRIDKRSPEYEQWLENHEPRCRRNYVGSSKAMETVGAEVLFKRSIEKHKLR